MAAVLGLAGFLRQSQRMVVCWTPQYFTRLWCVYEVASWIHLDKPKDDLCFFPTSLALLLFCGMFYSWVLSLFSDIWRLIYFQESVASGDGYIRWMICDLVIDGVAAALLSRATSNFVEELKLLPTQLQSFSLSKAQCFCCSHDHKAPETNARIPCDRKLVMQQIAHWFPSEVHNQDDVVVKFDNLVRTKFRKMVLARGDPNELSFRRCLLCGLPTLWRMFDHGFIIRQDYHVACRFLLAYAIQAFLVQPIFVKLELRMHSNLSRSDKLGSLVHIVRWLVTVALTVALLWPLKTTRAAMSPLPILVYAACLLCICSWLFCSPRQLCEALRRPFAR